MTPSLDALRRRDLEELAMRCAREAGTTLEDMFSTSKARGPTDGRRRFVRVLVEEHGWTMPRVGAFIGRDPSTIHYLLFGRKRLEPSRPQVESDRVDEMGQVLP